MSTPGRYFGVSVPRREDDRLLRGEGAFIDDLEEPRGVVFLAFVRSMHAHARIVAVDTAAAAALPGVVAVVSGAQFERWVRPVAAPTMPGQPSIERPMIAVDIVRYVGEAVAVVLAESFYVAEDAAELVVVEYEPLDPVVDVHAAMAPGATRVHGHLVDNILYRRAAADEGTDAAFAGAHLVVEDRFHNSRLAAIPMEMRGLVASFDRSRNFLTIWSPAQKPHGLRDHLAAALDMPQSNIRVIAPDVGGAFGAKIPVYPEEIAGAALARQFGRPVKWVQDRPDDLITSTHARDFCFDVAIALDSRGIIAGLRADIVVDVGAYSSSTVSSGVEAGGAGQFMIGPYRVKTYAYTVCSVATNKTPTGVYRGVAAPTCAFTVETLLDRAAEQLGLDGVEIRRRNLLVPSDLPYLNAVGVVCDTASHTDCLDRALVLADYLRFKAERSGRSDGRGRLWGIGLACISEHTGQGSARMRQRAAAGAAPRPSQAAGGAALVGASPGFDSAMLRMEPDGRVIGFTSPTPQGQGHETVFAQLAAEGLGVPIEHVEIRQGDTALALFGSGTGASRAAVSGGGAVIRAAEKIAAKLRRLAAYRLGAGPEQIVLRDGLAVVAGDENRGVPIRRLAELAYSLSAERLPQGEEYGLEAVDYYDPPGASYANAAHIACVSVDEASGLVRVERYVVVHDCGRMINPMIVDGQVQGGIAQGLGEALMEAVHYDERGQPLTTTLLDYTIPTSLDVPDIIVDHVETPSTTTEGGIKGAGEGGVIGAVPAIARAVADALQHFRPRIVSLPLTPSVVLALMQKIPVGGDSAAARTMPS